MGIEDAFESVRAKPASADAERDGGEEDGQREALHLGASTFLMALRSEPRPAAPKRVRMLSLTCHQPALPPMT